MNRRSVTKKVGASYRVYCPFSMPLLANVVDITGQGRYRGPGYGAPALLQALIQRIAWRNCLKTPVSSKTRVPGGPEAGKMGPFRRVMAAIPTLETPPSDFLDSFRRSILRSCWYTYSGDLPRSNCCSPSFAMSQLILSSIHTWWVGGNSSGSSRLAAVTSRKSRSPSCW
jgi:hypothetical protein